MKRRRMRSEARGTSGRSMVHEKVIHAEASQQERQWSILTRDSKALSPSDSQSGRMMMASSHVERQWAPLMGSYILVESALLTAA